MTASKYITGMGLYGGIGRMSDMTGVPTRTLDSWYNSTAMRARFDKILELCIRSDKAGK